MKRKEGFVGETSMVLSPMSIEQMQKDPAMATLYITDIGFYPKAEGHYCKRENLLDECILIYCTAGKGWIECNEKIVSLQADHYYIIPAHTKHAYAADENQPWSIYWIHYGGTMVQELSPQLDTLMDITMEDDSRIGTRQELFDSILNCLKDGQSRDHLLYACSALHYYLASLKLKFLYRNSKHHKEEERTVIGRSIHYMREHLRSSITLESLANYVGYSVPQFSTKFKKITGKSPIAYYNEMKVSKACLLLDNTNLKVVQISNQLGLSDALYFSRLFSSVMGMSPKAYRQRKQQ